MQKDVKISFMCLSWYTQHTNEGGGGFSGTNQVIMLNLMFWTHGDQFKEHNIC